MPADDRRDRMSGRPPAPSGDRMTTRPGEPVTPVHPAGGLGFTDRPGREYWWERLDPNARTQLLDRVGEIIEWWAYVYGDGMDRPYAVVLGRRSLAMSRPDRDIQGGPTNRLLVWSLREHSHREVRVSGVSGGAPAAPEWGHTVQQATITLPEHVRGFLGNLPVEAQQRLQEPFAGGDLVRESDLFYFGYPERFDFWCCLAGSRVVTFAAGTGLLLPGGQRAYAWELTCRQAQVAGGS